MDCRLCSEELTAYIDGELSGTGRGEDPPEHLEKCPPCHEELQALREAAAFVESHARDSRTGPGNLEQSARAHRGNACPGWSGPGFFSFWW